MSVIDSAVSEAQGAEGVAAKQEAAQRSFHRLAELRRCQGVSRRKLARLMHTDVATIKQQEQPTSDLLLSTLYAWQEVLDAPIGELLVEPDRPLSPAVLQRARMIRLMKTARAILERTRQTSIRCMAQMLIEQLCEIMPELRAVSPWHAVGHRRGRDELGQAAYRPITTDSSGLPVI
jgi:transcriptional regulator with XRE-family HTH domain